MFLIIHTWNLFYQFQELHRKDKNAAMNARKEFTKEKLKANTRVECVYMCLLVKTYMLFNTSKH